MPNTPPANVKPYRYPYYHKTEIEHLVGQMLTVLLAEKKDSPLRFCINYKALNVMTFKDRFPIPTVEELLDEFAGVSVFSKLELRVGYHQVRMHPLNIRKTPF